MFNRNADFFSSLLSRTMYMTSTCAGRIAHFPLGTSGRTSHSEWVPCAIGRTRQLDGSDYQHEDTRHLSGGVGLSGTDNGDQVGLKADPLASGHPLDLAWHDPGQLHSKTGGEEARGTPPQRNGAGVFPRLRPAKVTLATAPMKSSTRTAAFNFGFANPHADCRVLSHMRFARSLRVEPTMAIMRSRSLAQNSDKRLPQGARPCRRRAAAFAAGSRGRIISSRPNLHADEPTVVAHIRPCGRASMAVRPVPSVSPILWCASH